MVQRKQVQSRGEMSKGNRRFFLIFVALVIFIILSCVITFALLSWLKGLSVPRDTQLRWQLYQGNNKTDCMVLVTLPNLLPYQPKENAPAQLRFQTSNCPDGIFLQLNNTDTLNVSVPGAGNPTNPNVSITLPTDGEVSATLFAVRPATQPELFWNNYANQICYTNWTTEHSRINHFEGPCSPVVIEGFAMGVILPALIDLIPQISILISILAVAIAWWQYNDQKQREQRRQYAEQTLENLRVLNKENPVHYLNELTRLLPEFQEENDRSPNEFANLCQSTLSVERVCAILQEAYQENWDLGFAMNKQVIKTFHMLLPPSKEQQPNGNNEQAELYSFLQDLNSLVGLPDRNATTASNAEPDRWTLELFVRVTRHPRFAMGFHTVIAEIERRLFEQNSQAFAIAQGRLSEDEKILLPLIVRIPHGESSPDLLLNPRLRMWRSLSHSDRHQRWDFPWQFAFEQIERPAIQNGSPALRRYVQLQHQIEMIDPFLDIDWPFSLARFPEGESQTATDFRLLIDLAVEVNQIDYLSRFQEANIAQSLLFTAPTTWDACTLWYNDLYTFPSDYRDHEPRYFTINPVRERYETTSNVFHWLMRVLADQWIDYLAAAPMLFLSLEREQQKLLALLFKNANRSDAAVLWKLQSRSRQVQEATVEKGKVIAFSECSRLMRSLLATALAGTSPSEESKFIELLPLWLSLSTTIFRNTRLEYIAPDKALGIDTPPLKAIVGILPYLHANQVYLRGFAAEEVPIPLSEIRPIPLQWNSQQLKEIVDERLKELSRGRIQELAQIFIETQQRGAECDPTEEVLHVAGTSLFRMLRETRKRIELQLMHGEHNSAS